MTNVVIGGTAYSDDGTAARDMRAGGHALWLMPMIGATMTRVADAETAATAAAASAAAASSSAANLVGTSSTSLTIGTGSKSLTASTGRQWGVGQYLAIVDAATSTNAMFGRVTAWNSGTGALTVSVDTTTGSGTIASWNIFVSGAPGGPGGAGPTGPAGSSVTRLAVSSNTSIGATDNAKLIDASGTITLTFADPGTLGSVWWTYVRNNGTGEVTLAHTSGNIDGLASYISYPGEARLLHCDGSTIRSIVLNAYAVTYTGSGTFTRPPGYSAHSVKLWSGGGGGAVGSGAPGGGGGACAEGLFPHAAVGASVSVTIGSGGAGSTTANTTAGGTTSFGALLQAIGAQADASGTGGTAYLSAATSYVSSSLAPALPTAPGFYGGGSGFGVSATVHGAANGAKEGGTPGTTVFGGAGGNGAAGTAPGGGGGAKLTGTAYAGARGECRIWGIV